KLDRGDYDAIVLAAAGLKRLGLVERIRGLLPVSVSLPAAGQGALGIETRADRPEFARWLAPIADRETWLQVTAERAVSRVLGGSCRVPLAAYCETEPDGSIRLRACVASVDGAHLLEAEARLATPEFDGARALGERVALALLEQGAQTHLQAQ
ncbi:MAG TPA: hydroxymethylbilane synthase, partial [Quisquiliibacterium sp.]|nr:hydroxymethylbilane synthase [Quisquiliibacterium sp.]